MCGIAGFYSESNAYSLEQLKGMNNALQHRGPDADGEYMHGPVGLAHRRLSILDLSEKGNQPMFSHNKRYAMVFNGEIYNFNEIANEIKSNSIDAKNIMFESSSDSEIILEAFSLWGVKFVDKLNGMFAIAIYDTVDECLYLFRDRLGIKPLYYYNEGMNLVFASELKAILTIKQIPRKINITAVNHFFHLGFIPAPNSIYNNIFKLEAGYFIKVSKKGIDYQNFWSLKYTLKKEVVTSEKKALVQLSDLLMSSVQYQLKSDVPSGVFLSGGIDSSLITAMAVGNSNNKVNTFSIGFQENKFNEAVHSKAIANYLGTNHHEFIVSYKDAIGLIPQLASTYDEPYADSSAIPTMLVSKLAKQYVTVTLSGEGGDELFMGYGAYRWAKRLNNPAMKVSKNALSLLFSKMNTRYQRVGELLNYSDQDYLPAHIFSQEQYLFSQKEINEELFRSATFQKLNFQQFSSHEINRKLNVMEQQALFDLQYYLPDDLLCKVDRASMHYGLETRVPYLDHRVVEYALNISSSLKVKGNVSKYILKEILYQYIPKSYFQRPKQGFAIPLKYWLRHELSYLIDDFLNEKVVEECGVVKYETVAKTIQDFNNGIDYLYNRLWLLIVFHMWYKNVHLKA